MPQIACDIGGTFTDIVLEKTRGEYVFEKVLTTPSKPSIAFLQGVDRLLKRENLSWSALTNLVYATTVASNIIIERKGRNAALITTKGFRDVLEMGRQKRHSLYDLFIDKPVPLIPREMIREVTERIMADGTVLTPVDEKEVRHIVQELRGKGVTAIGICLLHSYINPEHEKEIAKIIRKIDPELLVSLSSEVSPVQGEYERMSTVAANAYCMPTVREYLEEINRNIREREYEGPFFVMQTNGGLVSWENIVRFPARMIESGPAAGVMLATQYARLTGNPHAISFDMGGTTAKAGIVKSGAPREVRQLEVDKISLLVPGSGLPINIPALDLIEIGAGGGSIATVDKDNKMIKVGPLSAGADPGPICYKRGGTRVTVTDANVVLGYLDPEYFLGGEQKLDKEAAMGGIREQVAEPLGLKLEEAAWGIHRIVNLSMEQAIRLVSIERGYDPREMVLIGFGGAGPAHAVRLAQALSIPRVIIPLGSGVASALGLLASIPKYTQVRSYVTILDEKINVNQINEIIKEMETEGIAVMEKAGCKPEEIFCYRKVEMRYLGQLLELEVDMPSGVIELDDVYRLKSAFREKYYRTYGYVEREEKEIQTVNWKVSVFGRSSDFTMPKIKNRGSMEASEKPSQQAYFPEENGYVNVRVFERSLLPAGAEIKGPAIIQERESTTVLPPGNTLTVDEYGNLIITVR